MYHGHDCRDCHDYHGVMTVVTITAVMTVVTVVIVTTNQCNVDKDQSTLQKKVRLVVDPGFPRARCPVTRQHVHRADLLRAHVSRRLQLGRDMGHRLLARSECTATPRAHVHDVVPDPGRATPFARSGMSHLHGVDQWRGIRVPLWSRVLLVLCQAVGRRLLRRLHLPLLQERRGGDRALLHRGETCRCAQVRDIYVSPGMCAPPGQDGPCCHRAGPRPR